MNKTLLLLVFLVTFSFSNAQELLIVDLSTENEITITATTGISIADVSGSDTTGFYLADFFTADLGLTGTLVSGDLTTGTQGSDGSPSIYRGGGGTDAGLNVWSYTADPDSIFTIGQQAFTGSATWTVSPEMYTIMQSAPSVGNIYFPADTADDIAGSQLVGTYIVTNNILGLDDVQSNDLSYFPNPVKDVLNISSQTVIDRVEIHNILGQFVSSQKINAVNGTVNTNNLATGAYFLTATFEDGSIHNFKVIKN